LFDQSILVYAAAIALLSALVSALLLSTIFGKFRCGVRGVKLTDFDPEWVTEWIAVPHGRDARSSGKGLRTTTSLSHQQHHL
jgi:hypothetical protein